MSRTVDGRGYCNYALAWLARIVFDLSVLGLVHVFGFDMALQVGHASVPHAAPVALHRQLFTGRWVRIVQGQVSFERVALAESTLTYWTLVRLLACRTRETVRRWVATVTTAAGRTCLCESECGV